MLNQILNRFRGQVRLRVEAAFHLYYVGMDAACLDRRPERMIH